MSTPGECGLETIYQAVSGRVSRPRQLYIHAVGLIGMRAAERAGPDPGSMIVHPVLEPAAAAGVTQTPPPNRDRRNDICYPRTPFSNIYSTTKSKNPKKKKEVLIPGSKGDNPFILLCSTSNRTRPKDLEIKRESRNPESSSAKNQKPRNRSRPIIL